LYNGTLDGQKEEEPGMDEFFRLVNTIQEYAWGSRTAIAELLGLPSPADGPQAELWMGAHPKAPSLAVAEGGARIPLPELIARDPAGILGAETSEKFSGRLPFLFKVLAAEQPLSIQAHPNREQARAGFRRENEQAIALDAFDRNYRDDNHKPEVICALSPFWALNGFRPITEMLDLLRSVGLPSIGDRIAAFAANPHPAGLKSFFAGLMRLERGPLERVLEEVSQWARRQEAGLPLARWLLELQELYPGDVGALSPLLLNLVCLEPGQAMFLEAGVLHAYLHGMGVELMANSDNVIRGGLTPKHMDVEQLLSVLRFRGEAVRPVEWTESAAGLRVARTPAEEFRLAELRVAPGRPYERAEAAGIELMIIVQGRGVIRAEGSLAVQKGDSLMIPASTASYSIEGSLHLYRASVPS
jgi:mannose-6-phosphate isomerase